MAYDGETILTNKKHPILTVEAGFMRASDLYVGLHQVKGTERIAIIKN